MDPKTMDALLLAIRVGDIVCDNLTERNEWRVRMLKAAFGSKIDFPGNWDSLPEEEKERRLDGTVQLLATD